ncbi:MAG: multicopper oxidase domain-containing protein [Saprospiraceae bacterium]
MKRELLTIMFFFAVCIVFAQHDMKNMPGSDTTHHNSVKAKEVIYTCPMHPEVQSSKPGSCPKCGMALEKKKEKIEHNTVSTQNERNQPLTDKSTDAKTTVDTAAKTQNVNLPKPTIENKESAEQEAIERAGHKIESPGLTKKPQTIRYDLYVADTTVNFSGKPKHALAINGTIPGPTLIFTEGDTAEVYVHNMLDETTSIHWHGVFLPNRFDGVPYLTQMPIEPHTVHLYKFPIIQNGTYWYHSHMGLQEQSGMYGALIFNKRNESDIKTIPVVLSDWTDMKPTEVNRSLHNASDWFAIKKGSTQSYTEALFSGHFMTKLTNEWKRMNAMDVSDVYYEKFLINGKNENEQPQYKAGDKVKLRIVNGSASTYFWLSYAGGNITVVGNDGNDVQPVEVDRLLIAVSETYDVIVTIPENMSYEFMATAEDRTNSASLWLGSGMKMPATTLIPLKYFEGMKMMNGMMKMNGDLDMMGMQMSNQTMDMNTVMYPEITGMEYKKKMKSGQDEKDHMNHMNMNNMDHSGNSMEKGNTRDLVTLNYGMLKATEKTTLPKGPTKKLNFELTGNMNRYVWTLDNKTISESDKILINKGENVKIILFNNTMMRHPMHLHGHDFRLLNGQGDYAPLKNVLDIMPMETDTIEFAATESGDWFFHCHILYHMMSGMGRIFSYQDSPPNPEIPDPKYAQHKLFGDDRMIHLMARVGIESNGSDGEAMLAQTRWKISEQWHLGFHDEHGYESETMLGKYLGKMQWLFPYTGFDYHFKKPGGPENIFGSEEKNMFNQVSNKNNRHAAVLGVAYTLPMLVVADGRLDSDGKFRFQLSREDISVTPRLRLSWMINTDKEYMAGLRYVVTKYLSLSSHYDSDMGFGGGITFTY